MIRQLRSRFIRIAMIAVTLVMLLLCAAVNIANYLSVSAEQTRMLRLIEQNQGVVPPAMRGEKPDGGRFSPELPFSTRYFVLRYTDAGELVQADLKHIAAVTQDNVSDYLQTAVRHGEGFGATGGYRYYVIHDGDNRWMAIFLDCQQEQHAVGTLAGLSLAAMAICIALVYLIVVLCSRRAIDPVVKGAERQKQFITDAGHELKTPITVISTSLKVLEMEVGKQKWIDKAQAQTEKLRELVQSLVTLSRMDEDASPLRFQPFSVSDAARETVDSFRDFAESNGHLLQARITPGCTFCGDEYAVRQLISILLDNAVKYASPGLPICFALRAEKKGIVLRTENPCENADALELNKLFDRFYRADTARSSGGFGIGLSIARSIAEGHRGTIRAERRDTQTIAIVAELRTMPVSRPEHGKKHPRKKQAE